MVPMTARVVHVTLSRSSLIIINTRNGFGPADMVFTRDIGHYSNAGPAGAGRRQTHEEPNSSNDIRQNMWTTIKNH